MLSHSRNDAGIALPLALLALLIVSFLVVSAIVTSGSELTGSMVHSRASSALYEADGAVEEYIAMKAADPTDHLVMTPASAPDSRIPGFLMHVARLRSHVETDPTTKIMTQDELFSVIAAPEDGRGRSVGAFIDTHREVHAFNLTVNAGLTVGGNTRIGGNATISDGSDNLDACSEGPAEHAVEVSEGSTITVNGNAEKQIIGGQNVATYTQAEMLSHLLGDLSLQDAINLASIKIKKSEFQAPSSLDSAGEPRDTDHTFNWGCPSHLSCATVPGNEANVEHFPMVAIDAEGGKVDITGDHGQGVLIIHNGGAEITGNMIYTGILIVQGDLMVRGTVQIQGAVVALGESSTVEDDFLGNSTITYNRCINRQAQAAANQQRLTNAPQIFSSPTFNWFEQVG